MTDKPIILDTPQAISAYVVLVTIKGLEAVKAGFRLNTMYTPKNLMAQASRITGKTFKARDYDGAIAALRSHLGDMA